MPVYTESRQEFAEAIQIIVGDLKPMQVSHKTKISDTYIKKMMEGRVPSEAILERFANGMDIDLTKLRIAAGYEQSDDPAEILESALLKKHNLSEEKRAQIVNMVRHELENLE